MMNEEDKYFMNRAIQLGEKGMRSNEGGPFGAVVVKNGKIIGEGWNRVTSINDPTAHAEIMAIRQACSYLMSFQLTGCTIYTSCEPCPMCLGAIYWARPARVYYAANKQDASNAGFDDAFIYSELELAPESRKLVFRQMSQDKAQEIFRIWSEKEDKTAY